MESVSYSMIDGETESDGYENGSMESSGYSMPDGETDLGSDSMVDAKARSDGYSRIDGKTESDGDSHAWRR